MNCFDVRRAVFSTPRINTAELADHLQTCSACSDLVKEVNKLDSRIHDAMLVPVPEALADRVLLKHKLQSPMLRRVHWALAASIVIATVISIQFLGTRQDDGLQVMTVSEAGQQHPAVAAINYVMDHEPRLILENRQGDPIVLKAALSVLGLNLPANASVRYLGKCPVPGGTGEHVVVESPLGHVTLILVTQQKFGTRVIITDRNKTAIAAPTKTGSYILVTDSADTAKRFEKIIF